MQIQRLSFDDQINYFETAKHTMRAKIGEKAANKLCNEATYLVGIGKQRNNLSSFFIYHLKRRRASQLWQPNLCAYAGSNDYVNNYLQPFLADGQQYTHDDFVQLLISTLEQQLLVREAYKITAQVWDNTT